MRKYFLLTLLSICLSACAVSPKTTSELQQGKRYFAKGYYKSALRQLLPAAANGNAEAQYAVGYLYYYGYGAAQDTETGYFWIKKSADQHYAPAMAAIKKTGNFAREKSR